MLGKYAEQRGWTLIDDFNRRNCFLARQMDISYSCKPVLIKTVVLFADNTIYQYSRGEDAIRCGNCCS